LFIYPDLRLKIGFIPLDFAFANEKSAKYRFGAAKVGENDELTENNSA